MEIIHCRDMINQDHAPTNATANGATNIDFREALFNEGQVGLITEIQVSAELIVRLNGIMFDLDLKLIKEGIAVPSVPTDPGTFYTNVVQPQLSRHPVLKKCEVRNSGSGLHAILWFDEPIEFQTDGEREEWEGIVMAVRVALPIDPDQPNITTVTRPLGSINGKNGAVVTQLCAGRPVTRDEVLSLYDDMQNRPFKTVTTILFGKEKIDPCPVCQQQGKTMKALDRIGRCYGSCGNVTLAQLYETLLLPRSSRSEERGAV